MFGAEGKVVRDVRKNYFISYCSKNNNIKEKTQELEEYFKREKIDYYLDNAHLKVNQNIEKFIEQISVCKYVVIFLSDDYFRSWWCMKECVKALKAQIEKDNIFCIASEEFQSNMNMPSKRKRLINQYCTYWENERIELLKISSSKDFEDEDNTLKNIITNIPQFIDLVHERKCCSSVESFINAIKEMGKNSLSEDIAQSHDSLNNKAMNISTSMLGVLSPERIIKQRVPTESEKEIAVREVLGSLSIMLTSVIFRRWNL